MPNFNPDGSITLPEKFQKKKDDDNIRFATQRCMKVSKEIVSFSAPKKCILNIKLSEKTNDNRFVETIFNRLWASVPMQLEKLSGKDFKVTVGTHLRRCTDCTKLINSYREFIQVIEEKGSCTFKPKPFCHEDHFE
ncbi:hypothetical protein GF351_03395 [Candidatus Woesearchaeota archaeon]|nr:hypothetical protein [Candidatus Woesearchaeota archaeon]